MKAYVDKDQCIGCGVCPTVCPEVFEMDNDVAVVIGDKVPPEAEESAKSAEEQCPVDAIKVE